MYGGNDEAWGFDNPCCSSDDSFHMGAGADVAHGGGGPDDIRGGDNGPNTDLMKAGAHNDFLRDAEGPDGRDDYCAGDGQDIANGTDDDGKDNVLGEGHPFGHQDSVHSSDPGDHVVQDGSC